MSTESNRKAMEFIENEKQFHLGFLPTEQSNPLTKNLDQEFASSAESGVRCLQRVDRNVLGMAERVFQSAQFAKLVETGIKVISHGGKIVFSGCGATGRLSILLESMWRECCHKNESVKPHANQVFSIMTGGDYALVRSVEFFEDYQEFGRQQVRETGMGAEDMLVAITEGGETSSVLGTVEEALSCGSSVFLMFNNPAKLLAEHLERSRRAIENSAVCVLDLSCGPMGLAGSTRMQATTSEQLVAGGALEKIMCAFMKIDAPDYASEFKKLLEELEASAPALASYIEFEAGIYRKKGKITYFADDFLLDIFTDTTERTPTFMLAPFRKKDDKVSPQSPAFVKNPMRSTAGVWENCMHRPLRCLNWLPADYKRLGAPEHIQANPPKINAKELLKFEVGMESPFERCDSGCDAAVFVRVGDWCDNPGTKDAFERISSGFNSRRVLTVGGTDAADYKIDVVCGKSPLHLMEHMAVKLVLNTASTGIMVVLGRVTGNWMSWVDVTNKKLMDRAIRLISELGGLDYHDSCMRLFEALEILERSVLPDKEKPSAVQYVLNSLNSLK